MIDDELELVIDGTAQIARSGTCSAVVPNNARHSVGLTDGRAINIGYPALSANSNSLYSVLNYAAVKSPYLRVSLASALALRRNHFSWSNPQAHCRFTALFLDCKRCWRNTIDRRRFHCAFRISNGVVDRNPSAPFQIELPLRRFVLLVERRHHRAMPASTRPNPELITSVGSKSSS